MHAQGAVAATATPGRGSGSRKLGGRPHLCGPQPSTSHPTPPTHTGHACALACIHSMTWRTVTTQVLFRPSAYSRKLLAAWMLSGVSQGVWMYRP